ncbi:MAG: UDP-N-acetylmuramate dehydrogenase [Candidatus Aminicenantes bacterium]|nr:UDP-N-acetylmuramate dehydrogenase [Candidatus Aminicenantes bacterium]
MSDQADEFARAYKRETGRAPGRDVPLREHSNFRIGGPADLFVATAASAELRMAVTMARAAGLRHRVIGGGFNLLFDDEGYRGLIIKNSARGIAFSAALETIEAASSAPIDELTETAASLGWGGLEFLAGIPGTIGGAVYGNAGAFGRAICDVLIEARIMHPDDRETRVGPETLEFGYRHSRLKRSSDILLGATLRLTSAPSDRIRAAMEENLALRTRRHPPRHTAYPGSYFKNPILADGTKQAAGFLLEQAGVRGLRIGGASVFPGHCNFIINDAGAAARDVLALAAEMKRRVLEKFGIGLEEEVVYLPASA